MKHLSRHPNPADLSRALRHTRSPEMRNRRWIIGLSIFSGALMLVAPGYAGTACLAGASDPDRAGTALWIPAAMGAKLLAGAALAGKLTLDQWIRHRAFCPCRPLSAGATFNEGAAFAAAALGDREGKAALRKLSPWDSNIAAAH